MLLFDMKINSRTSFSAKLLTHCQVSAKSTMAWQILDGQILDSQFRDQTGLSLLYMTPCSFRRVLHGTFLCLRCQKGLWYKSTLEKRTSHLSSSEAILGPFIIEIACISFHPSSKWTIVVAIMLGLAIAPLQYTKLSLVKVVQIIMAKWR